MRTNVAIDASRIRHRLQRWGTVSALLSTIALTPAFTADAPKPTPTKDGIAERHVYYTGGVHNDKGCKPPQKCIYKRKAGEPIDPILPIWWTSDWTMYRVFKNYDKFPPPYSSPPKGLTPEDYEVSYGVSYYDATYVPRDRDGRGAMMEHYDKRCLPIFPSDNKYTCSFVSLGNKAYFLRYDDRPKGTPQCCQFSLKNHPPTRDFIKHLPYNPKESEHLGGTIQAYSRMVPPGILFGYAFEEVPTVDSFNRAATPYRHPQSFYFSGQPTSPPDAPIVSQNYTSFRMQKPDPKVTWDKVGEMCPAKPQWCCLFDGDCPAPQAVEGQAPQAAPQATQAPGWNNLKP
ncbi:MAG TPA: hypothetical protein VM532_05800 [Burkholderiales bacterium]|nr:hypothetical protein [Burkholderiales bacterium]